MGHIALFSKKLPYLLVFCGLLVAAALFTFFAKDTLAGQLDAWKITPRPERLTELYFTNLKAIPAKYEPGDNQKIAFAVHNLEHRPTTYNFVIVASNEKNNRRQLVDGYLSLDHGQKQDVSTPITLPDLGKRMKITVKLIYSGQPPGADHTTQQIQTIHYWLEQT